MGFHLGTELILFMISQGSMSSKELMCFTYEINEDIFLLHNQYIRPRMMAFQGRKVLEQLLVWI